MPRQYKGPRLWKRPARYRAGKAIASAVWIIKDGDKQFATGCVASPTDRGPPKAAEEALSTYIALKHQPRQGLRSIHHIHIADVLNIYYTDTKDRQSSPRKFMQRIARLNQFFGRMKLGDLNTSVSQNYADNRGTNGGARRDLEDLRAAIHHHAKDNMHDGVVNVALPRKGLPRERFLTRNEVALLLWTCWRQKETQLVHRGPLKGQTIETAKRPLRHLARFILLGIYTGTRAATITSASPNRGVGRSYVDLDAAIFFRLPSGKLATKKRQTPVPIPTRLMAHLRRWKNKKAMSDFFVEWNGARVDSVKSAFASAVQKSGISTASGNVTPHTLRHTAATWLMQNGADPWQAAGFLGMSVKTLLEVYGHHHPEYMREAASAITRKGRIKNVTVVKSVVDLSEAVNRTKKPA